MPYYIYIHREKHTKYPFIHIESIHTIQASRHKHTLPYRYIHMNAQFIPRHMHIQHLVISSDRDKTFKMLRGSTYFLMKI